MILEPRFSIVGSCVSRDSIEFIERRECAFYLARSSLCSIFSHPPVIDDISDFILFEDAHYFHKDSIVHDLKKTGLSKLNQFDAPVIIDLIEERVPLGVLRSGGLVTLSQAARMYSNLNDIVVSRVKEFSDAHLSLFEQSMKACAEFFHGKEVFIHKALYVDSMQKSNENSVLQLMYEMLLKAMPSAILIEPDFRYENENHKWGLAPYHYKDEYYKSFVNMLSQHVECVRINNSVSMNK